MAFRVTAHSLALWATALLAVFDRAAHFTFRFAALNLAFGAAELLHEQPKNRSLLTFRAMLGETMFCKKHNVLHELDSASSTL